MTGAISRKPIKAGSHCSARCWQKADLKHACPWNFIVPFRNDPGRVTDLNCNLVARTKAGNPRLKADAEALFQRQSVTKVYKGKAVVVKLDFAIGDTWCWQIFLRHMITESADQSDVDRNALPHQFGQSQIGTQAKSRSTHYQRHGHGTIPQDLIASVKFDPAVFWNGLAVGFHPAHVAKRKVVSRLCAH